jgi:hypothetical protein
MRRIWPIFCLLATLAALAASGCGDDGDTSVPTPTGSGDARSLLATAVTKQFDGADVRMRAIANIPGFPVLGSRLVLTANGPLAWKIGEKLPTVDWNAVLRAGGQGLATGLSIVKDRVFVEFQGLTYEVDRKAVERFALDHGREPDELAGVSLRELGIDPSTWIAQAEVEDGEEIGGDPTRLVTGTVDVRAVMEDVTGLTDLSAEGVDRVVDAVERVDAEVNVDGDGYIRRVYVELAFTTPEDVQNAAFERGRASLDLVLEDVNGIEVFPRVPTGARPLSELVDFAGAIFGIDEPSDLWTIQP